MGFGEEGKNRSSKKVFPSSPSPPINLYWEQSFPALHIINRIADGDVKAAGKTVQEHANTAYAIAEGEINMRIQYLKPEDIKLDGMLQFADFLKIDIDSLQKSTAVESYPLQLPDDEYKFLHEATIIVWHDIIFCAWYNCPQRELYGSSVIRCKFSPDGGKTWSLTETVAEDPAQKLLYCPPVFGICDDELYMLVNTMVGADLMHSLEFYKFDAAAEKFRFLKSDPIPFKLNTNVYTLDNGKLMLPGRIAQADSFPATPAVLISDSGKINAPWRLVKIQKDKFLPDGAELRNPELCAIVEKNRITMFCRNDHRNVPIFYESEDFGESWSAPATHNIPFADSKIYSGTLSDNRNYLIGNICPPNTSQVLFEKRSKLAIFFSEPGTLDFTRGFLLQDGHNEEFNLFPQWSYPAAYEWNNKLYIIYTMSADGIQSHRGAMLSIIDIKRC